MMAEMEEITGSHRFAKFQHSSNPEPDPAVRSGPPPASEPEKGSGSGPVRVRNRFRTGHRRLLWDAHLAQQRSADDLEEFEGEDHPADYEKIDKALHDVLSCIDLGDAAAAARLCRPPIRRSRGRWVGNGSGDEGERDEMDMYFETLRIDLDADPVAWCRNRIRYGGDPYDFVKSLMLQASSTIHQEPATSKNLAQERRGGNLSRTSEHEYRSTSKSPQCSTQREFKCKSSASTYHKRQNTSADFGRGRPPRLDVGPWTQFRASSSISARKWPPRTRPATSYSLTSAPSQCLSQQIEKEQNKEAKEREEQQVVLTSHEAFPYARTRCASTFRRRALYTKLSSIPLTGGLVQVRDAVSSTNGGGNDGNELSSRRRRWCKSTLAVLPDPDAATCEVVRSSRIGTESGHAPFNPVCRGLSMRSPTAPSSMRCSGASSPPVARARALFTSVDARKVKAEMMDARWLVVVLRRSIPQIHVHEEEGVDEQDGESIIRSWAACMSSVWRGKDGVDDIHGDTPNVPVVERVPVEDGGEDGHGRAWYGLKGDDNADGRVESKRRVIVPPAGLDVGENG
ncbi:hypothetical protein C8R45DRAFT_1177918 [Mycena sanguinolenta]|nr:hypothetical protein C8R45DRAFT_1177918 [Mycena sanguinolenta]